MLLADEESCSVSMRLEVAAQSIPVDTRQSFCAPLSEKVHRLIHNIVIVILGAGGVTISVEVT